MWAISKRSRQLALSHAQLESLVLERTAELQKLSQKLLKVQDDERRKLARDLHDSTGQTLAALKISISLLEASCKLSPSITSFVTEVSALADQAIEEIRTMSYLLHPPLLDEVGFACAAEWFVEGFAKRSGIHVALDIEPTRDRLPMRIEIVLFRVLQESLTNVHRHSQSASAEIRLEMDAEWVSLRVQDHGVGIAAEVLKKMRRDGTHLGVGLAGMRERINELGGRLEVESNGSGTSIHALIPASLQGEDSGAA